MITTSKLFPFYLELFIIHSSRIFVDYQHPSGLVLRKTQDQATIWSEDGRGITSEVYQNQPWRPGQTKSPEGQVKPAHLLDRSGKTNSSAGQAKPVINFLVHIYVRNYIFHLQNSNLNWVCRNNLEQFGSRQKIALKITLELGQVRLLYLNKIIEPEVS